jgi:hypothetical protein
MRKNMKKINVLWILIFSTIMNACSVMTVNEHELQAGSADGVTFTTTGRPTYDQVWTAATKAMSNGMKIVYSHKATGTIKSRVGADFTGKVVAFFITPTTEHAPQYRIELVSKKPMGLGQPERRNWEPSVIEDFRAALSAK